MIHSVKLFAQSLALEYNGSGETVVAIEWGYSVTKSFSSETNWYISTIAFANYRSGVHGLFVAVQGVGFFANVHYNFSIAINDGNNIVFVINSCAERFSQCTDRNHRSPSAVYIRSSIAGNNVVVHNIFSRTDGHNNTAICKQIFSTKCIFESTSVDFFILGNNYNKDICSGFLISIQVQFSFTAFNSLNNFCCNFSVSIALIFYGSINLICVESLCNITIFVNDRNDYRVIVVDFTIVFIESKAVSIVGINHCQLSFNKLDTWNKCFYVDGGTKERFIGNGITFGPELTVIFLFIADGFTIETILYNTSWSVDLQAFFVNILHSSLNKLAKRYFIRYSHFIATIIIAGNHRKRKIFYSAKFINLEGCICTAVAVQSYSYFIFAWNQIFCLIARCWTIEQGIYAFIPYKLQIGRRQSRLTWFGSDVDNSIFYCRTIFASCKFITKDVIASQNIALSILQFKLNSIVEISSIWLIAEPFAVSASQYIATIFNSSDSGCFNSLTDQIDRIAYIVVSQIDVTILRILHRKGDIKGAIISCGNRVRAGDVNDTIFVGGYIERIVSSYIAVCLISSTMNGKFISVIELEIFLSKIQSSRWVGFVNSTNRAVILRKFNTSSGNISFTNSNGQSFAKLLETVCKNAVNFCLSLYVVIKIANTHVNSVGTWTLKSQIKIGVIISVVDKSIHILIATALSNIAIIISNKIYCISKFSSVVLINSPNFHLIWGAEIFASTNTTFILY